MKKKNGRKKNRKRSKFTKCRLKVVYAILRTIVDPFARIMHRFSSEKNLNKIKGPYLVLANHNLQLDAVLVGVSFKTHMFYVSSDHVMRKGFVSKLLVHLIAPIARTKGKTAASTVLQMIHLLKEGDNVCMFAEGNRSFNGVTGDIPDVTAKVMKKADVKVITYKITGGYFTEPRWSFSIRKGKCTGEIVHIYESEEIRKLSIDELNQRVREDLYVDAYKDQEINPIRFKGKNLAYGMETSMFMCPQCKSIGTLKSKGDEIKCSCGFHATYTEFGMLEHMPNNMDTITKWDIFQKNELRKQIIKQEKNIECPLFVDQNVRFYRVNKERENHNEKNGVLIAYADRLDCCGETIRIEDIPTLSIYARNSLSFMYKNEHCELKGEKLFSALKYKYLFSIVKKL